MVDFPPHPISKQGYHLEFHDEFDSKLLDTDRWIPYYLPQWSSREDSKPHYTINDSHLILSIEAEQRPWCPEFDGPVKVSSLQTGLFAGPLGSSIGQHRFNDDLVVREEQPTLRTYTPLYGYFEARVKAVASPGFLCALWMIGFEETPEQSGEIAIFELFGDQISPNGSEVRFGIHPWSDPSLRDEFYYKRLPIDATGFHLYAVEWTPTHIDFFVDNVKQQTVYQRINYPMQFMLNIYELPNEDIGKRDYPQRFFIDYFRAYRPEGGY